MDILGYVMVFAAGALLHDVPFPRFISAMMLMLIGSVFIAVN